MILLILSLVVVGVMMLRKMLFPSAAITTVNSIRLDGLRFYKGTQTLNLHLKGGDGYFNKSSEDGD